MPRVGQFFKLENTFRYITDPSGDYHEWRREFLGTYTRNLAFESKRIVHVPSSPALPSLATSSTASYSGASANTQTGSKKRKLSSQSSLDLRDGDEDDTEQPEKLRGYSG